MASQQIPCDAFQKNADGSWTPTRTVTMSNSAGGSMHITPGVSYRPGMLFAGVDIAKMLEEQCK